MLDKRVKVGPTPGKTKHFQTLHSPSLSFRLCDCPGLVFPVACSKSELVCNGILSADHIRDWRSPLHLLCERLGPDVICKAYNLPALDPRHCDIVSIVDELLAHHATLSSTLKKGALNLGKSARTILKDFVSGKLPHFELPPRHLSGA